MNSRYLAILDWNPDFQVQEYDTYQEASEAIMLNDPAKGPSSSVLYDAQKDEIIQAFSRGDLDQRKENLLAVARTYREAS